MRWMLLVSALAAVVLTAAPARGQTAEEANKATYAAFMEAQNARDYGRLDALVAADMIRHSQATPGTETMTGIEAFKAFLELTTTQFPDWRMECPMVVAEGDLLGAWCSFTGTQEGAMGPFPPTGKRMELDVAGIFRFEDGKIAEWWVTWDNLAGLTQVGLFPPAGTPVEPPEGRR